MASLQCYKTKYKHTMVLVSCCHTQSHTSEERFHITHRFPPQNTSLHYEIPKGFIRKPPFAHLPTILIIHRIPLDVSKKAVYLNNYHPYLTLRLWRPINLKMTTTFPVCVLKPTAHTLPSRLCAIQTYIANFLDIFRGSGFEIILHI